MVEVFAWGGVVGDGGAGGGEGGAEAGEEEAGADVVKDEEGPQGERGAWRNESVENDTGCGRGVCGGSGPQRVGSGFAAHGGDDVTGLGGDPHLGGDADLLASVLARISTEISSLGP